MKTIISVSMLFSLLLCVVIFNSAYIRQTMNDLIKATELLPSADSESCAESVERLYRDWSSQKCFIKLSADLSKVEDAESHLALMKVWADRCRPAEFEAERKLFIKDLSEISELEKFHVFA